MIELECVPESLKVGIVTPLYKGGGKDPLDRNSYSGSLGTRPIFLDAHAHAEKYGLVTPAQFSSRAAESCRHQSDCRIRVTQSSVP